MIKQFLVIFIFILSILSAGCAYQEKQSAKAGNVTPITVENFDGYAGDGRTLKQVFTDVPQRVLAVSEPVVDNLLFLGVQDKIVGISACYSKNFAPYETEYAKFARLTYGSGYPSKEAVLGLQPDLIVSWGSLFGESALGSVEYWHNKGIHTYVMTNTVPTRATGRRKVEYIVSDLQQLAKIFRVEEKAQKKIAYLQSRIAKLRMHSESIAEAKKPKVLTLQHLYGNEYFGRTANDLTADMIELAGGISLDDNLGGRKNVEYLVELDPDMIIVIDTATTPVACKIKALHEHKVLKKIKAVRNNKIFVVQHRAFYCGSERTVEAVEDMHKYIEDNF